MGNSESKSSKDPKDEKKPSRASSLDVPGPSLESYPSLGKSDTKESSMSFRGLRSKIPGKRDSKGGDDDYTDSPRGSTVGLDEGLETPDEQENKEMMDQMDGLPKKKADKPKTAESQGAPRVVESENVSNLPVRAKDSNPDDQQPASPSQSGYLGSGHHAVDRAQKSGEVENVSEGPPGSHGLQYPSSTQKAGESILIKTTPPPKSGGLRAKSKERRSLSRDRGRSKDRQLSTDGSMEIGALKPEQIDEMIQRLLDAGYAGKVTKSVCLKAPEIEAVCRSARELFLTQPALLELSPPVKIVGDVHGQYTDLLRLFEMCGFPPDANYLFLGDYVDRGKQSLETILLLMCYKLKFPENFFLLRGNHESANVTRVYGFFDECKRRTSTKIWKAFIDAFNALPIASIVAGKIFCVHGGLSPALSHMDDIRQIARPTDVPDYGLLNDLLWSDPADIQTDWESNERGVSYCFGKSVIMEFLTKHDFDLVCRAHMVVEDGYEFFADRILVTVFSAPNYCGEFDNYGAVMSVSGELLCSFELLKPLDSSQLKSHIKKSRNSRQNMLNSPPANPHPQSY